MHFLASDLASLCHILDIFPPLWPFWVALRTYFEVENSYHLSLFLRSQFFIGKGLPSNTLPSRDPPKSDRRSLSGLRSCGNYSLSAALELHLSAPQFAIRPNLNQQCGWEIIKLFCMLCWALLNSHITNLISHTGKWIHLGRRRKKYGRYGAPTLNIHDRVFVDPNQV